MGGAERPQVSKVARSCGLSGGYLGHSELIQALWFRSLLDTSWGIWWGWNLVGWTYAQSSSWGHGGRIGCIREHRWKPSNLCSGKTCEHLGSTASGVEDSDSSSDESVQEDNFELSYKELVGCIRKLKYHYAIAGDVSGTNLRSVLSLEKSADEQAVASMRQVKITKFFHWMYCILCS